MRAPRGSVRGSTRITVLFGSSPQTLYLPSLSEISVVPSDITMRTPGIPISSGSCTWLLLQSTNTLPSTQASVPNTPPVTRTR